MKKIAIWVTVIIIVLFVYSSYSYNKNLNATLYPVLCKDLEAQPFVNDFSKCKQPEALERFNFFIDTQKNEVLVTFKDTGRILKLDPCTIIDELNWDCGLFSKNDGNLRGGGSGVSMYVTESEWNSINNGVPGKGSNKNVAPVSLEKNTSN